MKLQKIILTTILSTTLAFSLSDYRPGEKSAHELHRETTFESKKSYEETKRYVRIELNTRYLFKYRKYDDKIITLVNGERILIDEYEYENIKNSNPKNIKIECDEEIKYYSYWVHDNCSFEY